MAPKEITRWGAAVLGNIDTRLRNRAWWAMHRWRAPLLIQSSGVFDEAYYCRQTSRAANGNVDWVRHYVDEGAARGLDPSPYFSTEFYLRNYPDVASSGMNPLAHYLLYGADEGRNPNPNFHTEFYLSSNPDVARSKLNPLAHYVRVGRGQRRQTEGFAGSTSEIRLAKPRCIPLENVRVTYLSGLPGGPSHRYRVEHGVASLCEAGIEARAFRLDESHLHEEEILATDVLVLFRVAWDEHVSRIVEQCRALGSVIVYDVDDCVFSPEIAIPEIVDGLRFLDPGQLPQYHDGVRRYRKALLACDFAILSTPYLAERARELVDGVHVLPNGFDEKTQQAAEMALRESRSGDDPVSDCVVRIGYLSGTLTHQKDFRVAAPALAKVLEENPGVVLSIVGLFELAEFPEFKRFGGRVERRPEVDYYELAQEFRRLDLHIAPLEIGNPFCESKSDLKFYEGGLVEIPLVASATDTFTRAIDHGKNGFLAHTSDEWYEILSRLVRDPELRRRAGRAARQTALDSYSPKARRSAAVQVFREITDGARVRRKYGARSRVVTIILPAMIRGGGGHHKLIQLAKLISKHGYSVLLQFTGTTADYPYPSDVLEEFDLDEAGVNVVFSDVLKFNSDITFCSFWKTVAAIKNSNRSAGRVFYFLQDYEPYFYPMGTEFLDAVGTLYEPFHRISFGPWIQSLLKRRHGLESSSVPFFIDRSIYRKIPGVKRSDKTILFVAQPSKPRRCFDLGVRALTQLFEQYRSDAKVVFFGSNDARDMSLPFPRADKGILPLPELAHLYNEAALAIVLSATNLSCLPYEMMACGLPVLDLDLEDSLLNYGSRENVYLAPVNVAKMAETIHGALSDTDQRLKVAGNGYEFARKVPDADESVLQLLRIMESTFSGRGQERECQAVPCGL